MNKYEQLEKFISEIQAGRKPDINTEDKEVLEVLAMAQKLASSGQELSQNFKENLEKIIVNNINNGKIMNQLPNKSPGFFPKWAYFTAAASVVVLIGGIFLWQNQRSQITTPSFQKGIAGNLESASLGLGKSDIAIEEKDVQPTVTVDDLSSIDNELLGDLSEFDSNFAELGSLGDELSGLNTDLAQINF